MRPRPPIFPLIRFLALSALGLGLLLAGPVLAGDEIYRWKDGEGRIHFGDRPPDNARELKKISGGSINAVHNDKAAGVQKTAEAFRDERQQKTGERKKSAETLSANEKRCHAARAALAEFEHSGFRYVQGDDGERRVLSDEEDKVYADELKARVDKFCR